MIAVAGRFTWCGPSAVITTDGVFRFTHLLKKCILKMPPGLDPDKLKEMLVEPQNCF